MGSPDFDQVIAVGIRRRDLPLQQQQRCRGFFDDGRSGDGGVRAKERTVIDRQFNGLGSEVHRPPTAYDWGADLGFDRPAATPPSTRVADRPDFPGSEFDYLVDILDRINTFM